MESGSTPQVAFSTTTSTNPATMEGPPTPSSTFVSAPPAQSAPPQPQTQAPTIEKKTSQFLKMFGAVQLANKGAVARDHLANERTFLAWLRTSLAFASIGVAITQFFRLQSSTTTRNVIEATREFGNIVVQQDSTVNSAFSHTSTASTDEIVLSPTAPLLVQTPEFYHYIEKIYIQDRRLSKLSTMLGSLFISLAVLTMVIGVSRYFWTQHYLQKGFFPVSRSSVTILFILTLGLIVTNFAVIIKTNL